VERQTQAARPGAATAGPTTKAPGTPWRDHLCLLLNVGAEIEHALLVQYLYAAYSLGGDQVPGRHRATVKRWQDTMLTVAREEMGHLVTVQNLLTFVGGPIGFQRRDFPFDTAYFPCPFRLEPLTVRSMAAYVFAEMPPRASGRASPTERRVEASVLKLASKTHWHHVGKIYQEITDIVAADDPPLLPDSAFHAESYARQAAWDEWGKGYRPPETDDGAAEATHGRDPDAVPRTDSHATVIVARMGTRQQALTALQEISNQGESLVPSLVATGDVEPSHFERFAVVYEGLEAAERDGWSPCRDVPVNPTTRTDAGKSWTYIECETSRLWADLSNLRYRMALTWLSWIFRLAGGTDGPSRRLRGLVLHRIFGEMYNMKALAGILMRSPLTDAPGDPRRAGPPFEMPYTLALPTADADCWRLHQDLLRESLDQGAALLRCERSAEGVRFLEALRSVDRQGVAWIDQVLAGLGAGGKGGRS
jgi:hypothetical protein